MMLKKIWALGVVGLAWSGLGGGSVSAEAIPEILVTGRMLKPSANEPAYTTTILGRDDLQLSAGTRLDDVLRAVPGFGLFRRQSSRAAHPTTQGVTLRGLGPSGAGRTLIMLDGIPQNDPFGGWVDWSRIPTASLDQAAVTRGAGAGPWGNAALAGVVRLKGRAPDTEGAFVEGTVGAHDTYDATVGAQAVGARASFAVLAHGHSTDGSYLIREDQRGTVDRRAADRGGVVELSGRYALNDDTVVRGVGRASESKFTNGIGIARSKTRVSDAALSVLHDPAGPTSWEINAYVRDQDFRAVFAAVNAARTTATPSLDQFAVPATAVGGNVIVRRTVSPAVSVDAGVDARFVDGATNENFQNQGAGFTRVRKAGGAQMLTGAFTEVNWQAAPNLLATIGGRVDAWQQNDGLRRESVLQTGAIVRENHYADLEGTVGTMRGGLRYEASNRVTLKAAGYTGFRLPTLNELYRPFRVGNDITEANPALGLEKLYGVDLGVEWAMSDHADITATYFHSTLKNAVTNITVQTTPGANAALGVVVPAGGVLRQRQNIDRIVADGVEAALDVRATPDVQVSLRYLFSSPNITQSAQQPALVGLRLAQVPRHQMTAQARWKADERLTLTTQARIASRQFDDDQNTRSLRGYVVVDGTVSYAVSARTEIFAGLENVFDRTIEAGRSADGLISIATPRTARLGLRAQF